MRVRESPDLRVAYLLTGLAAVAMAVVSAGGAFAPAWLYRDNPLITATFRGQDLVTVIAAVPLLVVGLILESRGSARGRVLWIAMLFYAFYSYLFYAFGAAFNAFFLLYVAIMGLALYALLSAVPRLRFSPAATNSAGRPARVAGIAYLLVVATGLGLLWTGMSASYLFTGAVPAPIVASGHPTGVVFAIDLVFIVPPMVIGAVGLIRRRAFGCFVAAAMCLSGTIYTLSLAAASVEGVAEGVGNGAELPLWIGLTLFGALASGLLLWSRPTGAVEAAAAR
ncbi:MAG TPA: hypothetical protein VFW55_04340 [Propionicimonas sp.]|nr:hypothetical protein [Propionicimonas sp.]